MRQVTMNVYNYSELDEKAKAKARDWFIENIQSDGVDDEYLSENILMDSGFVDATFSWSIAGGQGDGACFSARVELDKFLVGKYECLKSVDMKAQIVELRSNYQHERTKRLDIEYHNAISDEEAVLISELEREIEKLRIDLCKQAHGLIQDNYNYHISEENIAEFCDANNYEFDINGEFYGREGY